MTKDISLGTATAKPGTIQYGQWDAIVHPTGHHDFLPVIIAQGKKDGPCICGRMANRLNPMTRIKKLLLRWSWLSAGYSNRFWRRPIT